MYFLYNHFLKSYIDLCEKQSDSAFEYKLVSILFKFYTGRNHNTFEYIR